MLLEEKPFPESWLQNVVVFLPKVPTPSLPEHLRTIVLSSCVAKLFTKTLLRRFCVALMLFWSSRLDRPVEDSQIPNGLTTAISHSFISHSLRVGRVCAENDESQCGLSATTELSQFQLQGAACPQQPPSSMTSPSNSVMTSPSNSVAPCAPYNMDLLVCRLFQEKSFSAPLVGPCMHTTDTILSAEVSTGHDAPYAVIGRAVPLPLA